MLILSRNLGESIRIGPDILVTITRIKGSSVRVGIQAPKGTQVFRAEIDRDLTELPKVYQEGGSDE